MRTARVIGLLSVAFAMLAVACMDDHKTPTTPTALPRSATHTDGTFRQDRDRKDTPWQRMTDAELIEAVRAADGHVMIGFKDALATDGVDNQGRVLATTAAAAEGLAFLRGLDVRIGYTFQRIPAVTATITPELAETIRHNAYIDYIEPAVQGRLASQTTPWNIHRVGASSSWGVATGSGVKVLIIDTGAPNIGHRDLNIPVAWRCHYEGLPATTNDGHGTLVAGVVAALDNSVDVIGVSPAVTLYMANVIVGGVPNSLEVACSIDLAAVNGMHVVNMSFDFPSPETGVTDAINSAYDFDGILFVGAAGNTNGGAATYPATLSAVIAVTAVDSLNAHAAFAAIDPAIELSAPGVDIISTKLAATSPFVDTVFGTSYAAPHVTGAIALLKQRYPGWSHTQIRTRLRNTATDLGASGFDNTFGYGLLNVQAALSMSVEIGGPSSIFVNTQGSWGTTVTGGDPSYSYEFWIDNVPAGTSHPLLHTPTATGTILLTVKVTDSNSATAWGHKYVNVTECTDPCSE